MPVIKVNKSFPCCFVVLWLMSYSSANGVENHIDEYLLGAERETLLSYPGVEPGSYDASPDWINEGEFRFSGDDQDEQSLAIRIRPKTSTERRAESSLIELRKLQTDLDYASAINNELENRYANLLSILGALIELDYLRNKKRLDEAAVKFHQSLMHSEKFDLQDLQEASLDSLESNHQLRLYESRLQQLIVKMESNQVQWQNDSIDKWMQRLISISLMEKLTSQYLIQKNAIQTSYQFRGRHLRWQMAQQKLKREQGEANSWLKYVELKHVSRDTGDTETSLSLSIPFGGSGAQLLDREFAVNNADLSLRRTQNKLVIKLDDKVSDLGWHAEQFAVNQLEATELNGQLSNMSGSAQPGLILRLRSRLLSQQHQLRLIHLRAIDDYLDFLSMTGQLNSRPLKNWILRDTPIIQSGKL